MVRLFGGGMMRTIKFRGKSLESGLWYYGYYICHDFMNSHFIIEDDINIRVQVDPDTVGQFAGLLDKNGVEIYENDVVAITFWDGTGMGDTGVGVVEWDEESSMFRWLSGDPDDEDKYWLNESQSRYISIKGNITDNPELMRASDD